MTITESTIQTTDSVSLGDFEPVGFDLYRDIHKGIRAELFDLVSRAGRVDPAVQTERALLAAKVRAAVEFLVSHAEHEDTAIQPFLEVHTPELATKIAVDHEAIEGRMASLVDLAEANVGVAAAEARNSTHRLYVELAAFTADYLVHQDVEERLVMPALERAVDFETVLGIHEAIVSSIPPDQMARSLAVMLPAMNVDDRTEMLGGIREGAPPEAFAGVWDLATSVLAEQDWTAVAARLGVSV